jgi:uncharacterized protein
MGRESIATDAEGYGVMKKLMKWFGAGIAGIFTLSAGAILISGFTTKLAGEETRADGIKRNIARYVAMPDGTKIAVDIWFPANYKAGQKLPTIINSTRYWRATQPTFVGRALMGLGILPNDAGDFVNGFGKAGYAIIQTDARGSGASFGFRRMEWAPEEVADMKDIVSWIVAQPWSNGRVGGTGVSYEGNTAELLAASGHPAVKAVAPLYDDFDPGTFTPGGVRVSGFQDAWFESNAGLDSNNFCRVLKAGGDGCFPTTWLYTGVKPVDGAEGSALLALAVAEHKKNVSLPKFVAATPFDDDKGETWIGIADVSPYKYKAQIEAAKVPMMPWVGWHDGSTTMGAVGRFNTFSNDQHLVIGAYSHGGGHDTDPFKTVSADPDPSEAIQVARQIKFFDCYLKDAPPPAADCQTGKSITYYTMGAVTWKTTPVWPLPNTQMQRMYFGAGNSLSVNAPTSANAADRYTVDFSATTGKTNRWATQAGGGDVIYDNRKAQTAKLLTYVSPAMTQAMEITGHPVVTLHLTSTQSDGAFHVYMEDVAPDGSVRYLTEGVLRGSRRKVSAGPPPYWQAGPYHSLKRADYLPLVPGEMTELSFALFPTSALIKPGHKIRISLAGADKNFYARVPEKGNPVWNVSLGSKAPSFIDLPVITLGNTK